MLQDDTPEIKELAIRRILETWKENVCAKIKILDNFKWIQHEFVRKKFLVNTQEVKVSLSVCGSEVKDGPIRSRSVGRNYNFFENKTL